MHASASRGAVHLLQQSLLRTAFTPGPTSPSSPLAKTPSDVVNSDPDVSVFPGLIAAAGNQSRARDIDGSSCCDSDACGSSVCLSPSSTGGSIAPGRPGRRHQLTSQDNDDDAEDFESFPYREQLRQSAFDSHHYSGTDLSEAGPLASWIYSDHQQRNKQTDSARSDKPAMSPPTVEGTENGSLSSIGSLQVQDVISGDYVDFESLWQDGPVIVGFFRRFGCRLCRWGALQLSRLKPLADAAGVRLVAVGYEAYGLQAFVDGRFFDGDIYVDLTRASYRKLGLPNLGFFRGMAALLTDRRVARSLKIAKDVPLGDFRDDDGMQLGATFVVGQGGEIVLEHRQQHFGDFPVLDDLCEAIARVAVTSEPLPALRNLYPSGRSSSPSLSSHSVSTSSSMHNLYRTGSPSHGSGTHLAQLSPDDDVCYPSYDTSADAIPSNSGSSSANGNNRLPRIDDLLTGINMQTFSPTTSPPSGASPLTSDESPAWSAPVAASSIRSENAKPWIQRTAADAAACRDCRRTAQVVEEEEEAAPASPLDAPSSPKPVPTKNSRHRRRHIVQTQADDELEGLG